MYAWSTVGVLLLAAGCGAAPTPPTPPSPMPVRAPSSISVLLAKVRTVPTRPHPGGYDRDCSKGHGCVFGRPWVDVDHNKCDTRDDVLAKQLDQVTLKPGSRCTVLRGVLTSDPYTGRRVAWTKTHPSVVQIDHLYPLAYAWDMGADRWPLQRRVAFANDQTLNLLAVDGPANQAKGDSGPGEWLPINTAYRCRYVARFLTVASTYDLPITVADADSIRHTARGC